MKGPANISGDLPVPKAHKEFRKTCANEGTAWIKIARRNGFRYNGARARFDPELNLWDRV